jgi:hypothetical protein
MYVCMYVFMYVCMYVCMHMYVYTYLIKITLTKYFKKKHLKKKNIYYIYIYHDDKRIKSCYSERKI